MVYIVTRLLVAASFLLPLLAAAPAHAVDVEFDQGSGELSIVPIGNLANDVTVTRTVNTIVVTDAGENVTSASCSLDTPNEASCTVAAAEPFVAGTLGDGNDSLALSNIRASFFEGGADDDELSGSALPDSLLGGEGEDTILGGGGADQLFGEEGKDSIDGGGGHDSIDGGGGADHMFDTGGGSDVVTYFNHTTDPAGVEVTLNGEADDGNFTLDGEGKDNVDDGIDAVQGSIYADELRGGPGADRLSGAAGDDVLVGNGGADTFNGAEGNDTVEARDGEADADIDCDNSMGSHGTADVAIIDSGVDPAPRNCETVDGASSGGGVDAGGGAAASGAAGGAAKGQAVAGESTLDRGRMPGVIGSSAEKARQAVLAQVAGVDLDILFQRGCKQASDLEVVRQRPAKGARLSSYEGADLPVRLYVCIDERDFLADCDLKDLRADISELPRRSDVDLGLTILEGFKRCKVDYDVKLVKKAEEAQLALAAQKAPDEKGKGGGGAQIRAAVECPTAPEDQDLRLAVTEGYVATRGNFGLHTSGPKGWTLPANAGGDFTSYIDIYVLDRVPRLVEATLYIDGEGAGIPASDRSYPNQSAQRVEAKNGRARLILSPRKAGKIKICAVYRTGDEQALTGAVEVDVIGPLKVGDTWKTISGRELQITKNGPVEKVEKLARISSANPFNEVWQFLVGLFGGASRSIEQASREQTVGATKLRSVQKRWAAGQITLDGTLTASPRPPSVQYGPCLGYQSGGALLDLQCPQLMSAANSALVGISTNGAGIVAAGAGNALDVTSALVAAGAGNLVSDKGAGVASGGGLGAAGATLVAAASAKAISTAPAQLIGADGASLIGFDGATLIGADGATLIGPDGATLIGADGATIIGRDGAS